MTVGIDGVDANTKLAPVIADDDLNDAIFHLAQSQGPDADATNLVKQWLAQNMPELLDQIDIGNNNARDQQTNWAPPVSPQQAQPHDQYGTSSLEEPNVNESNDGLDFIRSLAGIRLK